MNLDQLAASVGGIVFLLLALTLATRAVLDAGGAQFRPASRGLLVAAVPLGVLFAVLAVVQIVDLAVKKLA